MGSPNTENPAVRARAVLVDPQSMAVVWANEAAGPSPAPSGAPDVAVGEGTAEDPPGMTLEQVVPMAEPMGVAAAVAQVAQSGVARHLQTDLVSMSRGAVAMVTSIYRLPNGHVLIITENTWQMGRSEGRLGRRR